MRRLLKPTGSIYLHSDQTMSHYLKLVMDAIFGRKAFRSDISWVRQAGEKNDAVKAPGRVQNRLLFYGEAYYPARVRRPLTGAQRVAYSIQHPVFGASKSDNLLAPETRTGESGLPWRGFDPGTKGRHWSPPRTGRLGAWIEEQLIPGYTKMGAHARLDALDTAELLHWPEKVGGWPTVIRPISISQGTSLTDLWDDVGVKNDVYSGRVCVNYFGRVFPVPFPPSGTRSGNWARQIRVPRRDGRCGPPPPRWPSGWGRSCPIRRRPGSR